MIPELVFDGHMLQLGVMAGLMAGLIGGGSAWVINIGLKIFNIVVGR